MSAALCLGVEPGGNRTTRFDRSVRPMQLHPGQTFAVRPTTALSEASYTSMSYDSLRHDGAQRLEPWLDPHSGAITAVAYNNRSALPPPVGRDDTGGEAEAAYAAWRALGRLCADVDGRAAKVRLAPGDALVIDNSRVMHGRAPFSGAERHLQGCYVDADGVWSELAVREAREVEGAIT